MTVFLISPRPTESNELLIGGYSKVSRPHTRMPFLLSFTTSSPGPYPDFLNHHFTVEIHYDPGDMHSNGKYVIPSYDR